MRQHLEQGQVVQFVLPSISFTNIRRTWKSHYTKLPPNNILTNDLLEKEQAACLVWDDICWWWSGGQCCQLANLTLLTGKVLITIYSYSTKGMSTSLKSHCPPLQLLLDPSLIIFSPCHSPSDLACWNFCCYMDLSKLLMNEVVKLVMNVVHVDFSPSAKPNQARVKQKI